MTEARAPTLCDRMAITSMDVVERVMAEFRETIARGQASAEEFEPLALVGRAARGDIEAQRKLAMFGAILVCDDTRVDQTTMLAEAIMMARLAAAQGSRDDRFRLAMLLGLGASISWSCVSREEWAAECVARLELLADDADEQAAELLAAFAGTEKPEVLQEARLFRARLLAVEEADA